MNSVWVGAEWGALKEVIVGIVANVTVPQWTDEYEFAPEEEQHFVHEHGGRLLSEVAPERHHRMAKQLEQLANFLEELGIRVHRPRVISEDEDQFLAHIRSCRQQLFPRDPVIVIGDNVIEGSLRDPMERKSRWAIRDLLFTGNGIPRYIMKFAAIPEPQPVIAESGFGPGPFLEGGDVLVCNNRIFVGESGHASNEWGVSCLRQYIGPDYELVKLPLSKSVLHLDCALSLPREGLAIACIDAMPEGLPAYFSDWDVIEISLEEASYLACNGLVIDESHYLCAAEHPRIAEALNAAGQEVSVIEFDAVSTMGGGLRCAHHPLRRE
jgi:glycine amidinotransferase